MTLTLNVFGIEIAKLELDTGEGSAPTATPLAAKGIKLISKQWIKGMLAG